jgi:hypothetical protein
MASLVQPDDRRHRPVFIPWDLEIAGINFGANCGPISFAVTVEREVCRTMKFFPHFNYSRSTNLTQMLRAYREVGYEIQINKCELPEFGVALIQWTGPWTAKHFFSRWSLFYTHWIAVKDRWIFDHTVGEWLEFSQWENEVTPDFISQIPRATGWAVKYGVGLIPSKNISAGSGMEPDLL